MNRDIEILYEDKDILVCRKEAGIAVQSANVTASDMESRLRSMLFRRTGNEKTTDSDIYIIHRLDQPVEGIVVFAKNKKAAADLNKQVQSGGGMNKVYLAAVCGRFPDDKKEGELKNFLIKDPKTKCAKVVSKDTKQAKEAILKYKVIMEKDFDGNIVSVVEICLETGRFHQIRAQFPQLGQPLLGDKRYGTKESNDLSNRLDIRNVSLCAKELIFKHPSTGKTMKYEITPAQWILNTDDRP